MFECSHTILASEWKLVQFRSSYLMSYARLTLRRILQKRLRQFLGAAQRREPQRDAVPGYRQLREA